MSKLAPEDIRTGGGHLGAVPVKLNIVTLVLTITEKLYFPSPINLSTSDFK